MEADRVFQAVEPADRWPGRIRIIAARWRQPSDPRAREADLAEMWRILNLALHRAIRFRAGRHSGIDAADVVEIAADKAMELLGQMDQSRWEPASWSDAQISAYLATVARNGLVDLARRRRREIMTTAVSALPSPVAERAARDAVDLELSPDGRRYARAIVDCASRLPARARRAWFLRVFCDFTAAEIAGHPDVRTTAGGADLMLNRSRRQIRTCMQAKGFEPARIPPGTFAALWEMFRSEREAPEADA